MKAVCGLFGYRKRSDEPMKPVVDPATIVEPVDFFSPEFPYEQGFKEVDAYIHALPEKGYVPVSDVLRLQFYALYKQATLGDIDEKKVKQPNVFRDWEGYWKVVGWRKCKGMSKERARDLYIDLLDAQINRYLKLKWGAPLAEDRWAAFYDGVRRIQNLPKNGYHLSDELRARFYATFKQATVGDLKDFQKSEAAKASKYKWLRSRPAKPGFDQLRYDDWLKLEGMTSEYAKRLYCKQLFNEAALYGYVWDPPGTEGHLEVVGDQTTAKNFKRMDSEQLKSRATVEHPSNYTEAPLKEIEGAGVKLSVIEKLTLKKYMSKEQKRMNRKFADPSSQTASPSTEAATAALAVYVSGRAETSSSASEAHVDPNASTGEPTATDAAALTMAEGADKGTKKAKGEELCGEENGESSSAEEEKVSGKPEAPPQQPVIVPAKQENKASGENSDAAKETAAAKPEKAANATTAKSGEAAKKGTDTKSGEAGKKKGTGTKNSRKTKK